MKSTYQAIAIVLTLAISATAQAQDKPSQPLLKVLATKGANRIDGQKAILGMHLNQGQKIQIAQNGYIALAHTQGGVWETIKPGEYNTTDIAQEISKRDQNLKNRYYQFVADELTGKSGDRSRFGSVKTGSVTRGQGQQIYVALPRQFQVVPKSKAAAYWYPLNRNQPLPQLTAQIKTPTGEIFTSQILNDTVFTFTAPELADTDTGHYYLQFFTTQDHKAISPKYILINADKQQLLQLMHFVKDYDDHQTPMDYLGFAYYLDSVGLYANAISVYQRANEKYDIPLLHEQMDHYLGKLRAMQGAFPNPIDR